MTSCQIEECDRWRMEMDIEPDLCKIISMWHSVNEDIRTSTRASIAFLSTSWSPVYTTHLAFGQRFCVALMAAQRTRSPPPPALLRIVNLKALLLCSKVWA
jgi:hypothetical protein